MGQVGTGTLSHDLNRWWYQVRGKENPYLKIGDTNDRSTKGTSDYVWALQDINFEVDDGSFYKRGKRVPNIQSKVFIGRKHSLKLCTLGHFAFSF